MKDVIMTILQVVLIATIPVIAGFVCRFLWAKKESVETNDAYGEFGFILAQAMEAVITAVSYVCQTYVDGLKKSGKFTVENQRQAFQMAYDRACLIMTQEAKDFITEVYGSFSEWLTSQIEAQVREQKSTPIVESGGNPCGFLCEPEEEPEEEAGEIGEHPPDDDYFMDDPQ